MEAIGAARGGLRRASNPVGRFCPRGIGRSFA